MQLLVHVATIDEVPAARSSAQAVAEEGDEIQVIVGAPVAPKPADRQPTRKPGAKP